jgi:hypothetical protein
MRLRSLLLAALLLAALAAAQWSDVIYAYAFDVAPAKACAPNGKCVYVVKLNMSEARHVIAGVAGYFDPRSTIMHPHGVYADTASQLINIYMPAGVYFSDWTFSIDGMQPAPYTVCGLSLQYAIYVSRSGRHNLTLSGRVYYIDPRSCFVYLFTARSGYIYNITSGRAVVFWFEMPGAAGVWSYTATYDNALNGMEHQYRISWRGQLAGAGIYIGNYTRIPTFAAAYSSFYFYQYGPVHLSALSNSTTYAVGDALVVFNIAQPPSDGIFLVKMPDALYGKASITCITNETAVYVNITNNALAAGRYIYVYAQRYAIGDVTVLDDLYAYSTRFIACPRYYVSPTRIGAAALTRLDRVREIEICANRTDTLYVMAAYYSTPLFVDVLPPGDCHRIRWDASYPTSGINLYFYRSPQAVCRNAYEFYVSAGTLTMSWRYALLPNNTLKPIAPISLDALYEAVWRQVVEELRRQHNMTQQALQQWLQMQANASRSLSEFIKSQPRFVGTIRVESATSAWLSVLLSEIQKYAVAAPPPPLAVGGFTPAPLPGASALSAAAATSAVAVAWATSRRSLATAAFLAGFAILASALFVYYLYGTSVSAALIFAAVLLMAIGAAAVWFRKSED